MPVIMNDRLDFHRQHPEVSVRDYLIQKEADVLSFVCQKSRIYLDQNYWIYCRDVEQDRPQREDHALIYALLAQGVERSLLVCPANYTVVHETRKQKDPDSRLATARVIDRLSGGVAVKNFFALLEYELLDYWDANHGEENVLRRTDFCWTKIGCFLGTPIPPDYPFLSVADNLATQKAFLDYMFEVPLVTLMERCYFPLANSSAEEVNQGCAEEPDRTFDQLFQHEVLGTAFTAAEMLLEETGNNLLDRDFIQKIVQTITPEYVGPYMRCLRIQAALKAEVRYQKQRNEKDRERMFTPNDFADHNHATVALPHCHFFFTERVLTHLIQSPRLRYDEMFECKVLYRPTDIINALTELLTDDSGAH